MNEREDCIEIKEILLSKILNKNELFKKSTSVNQ